jgi:hypothetical protein
MGIDSINEKTKGGSSLEVWEFIEVLRSHYAPPLSFFDSHSFFVFTERTEHITIKKENKRYFEQIILSLFFLTTAKQSLFSTNSFLEETETQQTKPSFQNTSS